MKKYIVKQSCLSELGLKQINDIIESNETNEIKKMLNLKLIEEMEESKKRNKKNEGEKITRKKTKVKDDNGKDLIEEYKDVLKEIGSNENENVE